MTTLPHPTAHQRLPYVCALASGASLGVLLWLSLAHAGVAVQVRGSSELVATMSSFGENELWLQGRLVDDQGQPIANAAITILTSAPNQADRTLSPLGSCNPADTTKSLGIMGHPSQGSAKGEESLIPRADGSFCVRLSKDAISNDATVRIAFRGSEAYDGTQVELVASDFRAPLLGRFDSLAHNVSLDDEQLRFRVTVAKINENAPRYEPEFTVELLLHDESNSTDKQLRRLLMREGEPTAITLTSAELGPPGPTELILHFGGNEQLQPMRVTHPLTRTIQVKPTAVNFPRQAIAGDKLSLTFMTTSRLGAVGHGAIELTLDGTRVLVEPVSQSGRVEFVFATSQTQHALSIQSRYLPSREGYLAAKPDERKLALVPPSLWRHAIWLVPGLLVLSWLGLSRRNSVRSETEPKPAILPSPRAHVEVIGPPSRRNLGWEGFLVDAHEGKSIGNAQIFLREPGFNSTLEVHRTHSDQDGAFSIPAEVANRNTLELVVRASHYMAFRTHLPTPGMLRIHLVSVRRGLLDRLVEWTKRRGGPYRSKTEPTPDWVAQIARVRGQAEVEQWAKALGTAAFQAEPPTDSPNESLSPPTGPTPIDPGHPQDS